MVLIIILKLFKGKYELFFYWRIPVPVIQRILLMAGARKVWGKPWLILAFLDAHVSQEGMFVIDSPTDGWTEPKISF